MSEAADVHAEILKLARLLSRDPADLVYLADAQPADLRRMREQVTDVLFDADGHALGRLAAASKLLPAGLLALLAERAFGPVLAARIAGMLEPSRLIDVAAKLPAMFLADAATHIDPRRASAVIAGIPPAHLAEVTRELARRGEFETIGRFVGHLDTESTAAALEAMDATTAVQFAAAGRPRGRAARFLTPALVTLVAIISIVVTTSPDSAAPHSKPASSSHAIVRRLPRYWIVRSGDTFAQISEKTGMSIGQLEAYNPNIDPRALVPGERLNLRLHPPAPPPKSPGPRFWTVGSGESFGSIAAKTGINLATLERLNPRLKPATLQPGDRVSLPMS